MFCLQGPVIQTRDRKYQCSSSCLFPWVKVQRQLEVKAVGLLPGEPFSFTLLYGFSPHCLLELPVFENRVVERRQKTKKTQQLSQDALVMMGEQHHFCTRGTVHTS